MNIPLHTLQNAAKSPITSISFNADKRLFASAEVEGWRVFDTGSLNVLHVEDIPNGSLGLALPLNDSDLIFLVGGPPSPLYAPNKVIIYSLSRNEMMASLEFQSTVLRIEARLDRLVVVLKKKVVLFALFQNEDGIYKEGTYETVENPKGLVALATETGSTLLAFPGRQAGQVAIVRLPPLQTPFASTSSERKLHPTTTIILAHTTALSALCCTSNGSFIATSSIKGTLVRVWNPNKTVQLIHELRRGTDTATVFSLALRPDGAALAAASDKGTIHIWLLDTLAANTVNRRRENSLLKPYLPKYFSSQWSDGQFRLPPPEAQPSSAASAALFSPLLDALAEEKREKSLTVEDDHVYIAWLYTSTALYKDDFITDSPFAVAAEEDEVLDWCLIAITQSGSWFKIKTLSPSYDDDDDSKESQRKKKVREEGYGAEGRCELVSFRQFATRDGW